MLGGDKLDHLVLTRMIGVAGKDAECIEKKYHYIGQGTDTTGAKGLKWLERHYHQY